jgi:4-hydroxy-L-threonine phosphate dehydrogenase PdxA
MTSTSKRPLLGITMGDPGGIGPEVCAKALCRPGHFYRLPANDHR